uniref:Uncharacterized protein n=1 Tax=Plectus sambesii TaxID=2011161 RepID=A0A914V137_9BILA
MFLISKIVRGRRLMHELEHEEATAAAAAAAAASSLSVQLPRKKSSGASDRRISRRLSSIEVASTDASAFTTRQSIR